MGKCPGLGLLIKESTQNTPSPFPAYLGRSPGLYPAAFVGDGPQRRAAGGVERRRFATIPRHGVFVIL